MQRGQMLRSPERISAEGFPRTELSAPRKMLRTLSMTSLGDTCRADPPAFAGEGARAIRGYNMEHG